MIRRYKTNAQRRKIRTRSKLSSITTLPRLSVFRSNKHIYAQIVNQKTGVISVSASDFEIKSSKKLTKTETSELVGKLIGEKAIKDKITKAVFDRGSYKFHGRVKAVCEGARKSKLII